MKILFVCTGNTCRSPMAEALFRQFISEYPALSERLQIGSAGTGAWEGEAASRQALAAMAEQGLDLSRHRAVFLTGELVQEADLILTMTRQHKERVLRLDPGAASKVYTLKEFAGINEGTDEGADISDPYGQPLAVYRRSRQELEQSLKRVVEKLLKQL